MVNLKEDCDIMIDQMRAIDNRRLQKRLGKISEDIIKDVKYSLAVLLDLYE